MEIFNSKHEEQKHAPEPIRGSIFILIAKLTAILLLFETLYGAVYYILSLGIPLPFDLPSRIRGFTCNGDFKIICRSFVYS